MEEAKRHYDVRLQVLSVKNSSGYPGADADTDHVLAKMNIK